VISDIDLEGLVFDRALIAPNENTYPHAGEFSAVEFNGVFDGGGHVVRNLRIGTVGYGGGFLGLFGCIGATGIVMNTVISNAVAGVEYCPYAGGLLCGKNRGLVQHCSVYGEIVQISDAMMFYVGGVCGVNEGVFAGCAGEVTFKLFGHEGHCLGGFVGFTEGVISNAHVLADFNQVADVLDIGGFSGFIDGGSVSGCSATMQAKCIGCENVGGFVGYNNRGSVLFCSADSDLMCDQYSYSVAGFCGHNESLIEGCSSLGRIYSDQNDQMPVGGFCASNEGDIKSSMSSCDIVSDDTIVGAAGFCVSIYDGSIENCFCVGQISSLTGIEYVSGFLSSCWRGRVSNCYSATKITSEGYYSESSGFCRSVESSTITNCFWDADTAGTSNSSGGVGKTTAEMQNQDTYMTAGWDFVNESGNGTNDLWIMSGYPRLMGVGTDEFYSLSIVGGAPSGGLCAEGSTVFLQALPAELGTAFQYWSIEPGSYFSCIENIYLQETIFVMPSANVVVTANYVPLAFIVNFDLGAHGSYGGGGDLEQVVNYGTGPEPPVVIQDAGWVFTGWDVAFNNITSNTFITAIYQSLVTEIEVVGPVSVREMSTGDYVCIATYSDGSTEDVSTETVWSLENAVSEVNLDNGSLTVQSITSNLQISVVARYQAYSDQLVDDLNVSISNLSYSGGTGTEADPYRVATSADLLQLSATRTDYDKYFLLIDDIDLAGQVFSGALIAPSDSTYIYSGTKFAGVFDGGGHDISSLTINTHDVGNDYLGLFGYLDNGAVVSNIRMTGATVVGQVGESDYAGALCGFAEGAVISNCCVQASVSADDYVGVLCGKSIDCAFANCSSSGSAQGDDYIGGLCGRAETGMMENSFSSASVTGDDYTGGFVGYLYRSDAMNCYSCGFVTGDSYSGGFAGRIYYSTADACFWDTQSSGYATSAGGAGKTTVEMQTQTTFTAAGWGFADVWYMDGYPALRCFNPPGTYNFWLMNNPAIPAGLRAETDTPADDGIPNLLKYACGLPAMAACCTADLMTIEPGSSNMFSVLYYKAKSAQDVTLQPIRAEALAGPWSVLGIVTEKLGEDAEREEWKASVPLGESGFIKLRATAE